MQYQKCPGESTKSRREKGFTLIEILVVIVIIGILAAIAVPQFMRYKRQANDSAAKQQLQNLALVMEGYYVSNNDYGLVSAGGLVGAAALEQFGYRPNADVTLTRPSPAPPACADEAGSCWTAEAFNVNGTPGAAGLFKWDSAVGGAQW